MSLLITFYSVQHAYRAEKICRTADIDCKLTVIPMSLSSSCNGLALEFADHEIDEAISLLETNKVKMAMRGVKGGF